MIGGNGDSIFKRLMAAAGRSDMAEDPAMANNAGRIIHEDAIDEALGAWCASHSSVHIINTLEEVGCPLARSTAWPT